jgi:hypothetical protein
MWFGMDSFGKVGSAPACYGSNLDSNPVISQKYKNGRRKQTDGQHNLARQKIYKKKNSVGGGHFCGMLPPVR